MSLKARIQQDMKDAMRAGEKAKLATIRLILAAIKQKEVDERKELDDIEIALVLEKMVKQRRESISQFEKAGRTDLVEREAAELAVIQPYLPEQLSESELNALIEDALRQSGAVSMKDMGKVMALLKPRIRGRRHQVKINFFILNNLKWLKFCRKLTFETTNFLSKIVIFDFFIIPSIFVEN